MITLILVILSLVINLSFITPSISLKTQAQSSTPTEQISFYLSMETIFPAQLRYSSRNVEEKIQEIVTSSHATWDDTQKKWNFAFDQGNSAFSLEEALPVIKGPHGYVLADGHHHAIASLKLQANTLPVYLLADLSHLSVAEFWEEMELRGWAYLIQLDGTKSLPPNRFEELKDDPNRYFAAITARKYAKETSRAESSGAAYPLWIKIGKDTPFIEFRISDALRKEGIEYRYDMELSEAFIEQARSALIRANIPGLKLVSQRLHYTEISL